ncbi:MAG: hypothetical protein LBP36_02540 [Oscillospiraceae bacterium]|nr:hypothetical protein [Oscillospiraceae bacterium]
MKFKFRNMVFAALAFISVASAVPSKGALRRSERTRKFGSVCSNPTCRTVSEEAVINRIFRNIVYSALDFFMLWTVFDVI